MPIAYTHSLPPLDVYTHHCMRVGRLCGSKVSIQLNIEPQGTVLDYSYQTEIGSIGFWACTQVFDILKGSNIDKIQICAQHVCYWLEGKIDVPPPPPFEHLAPLRAHRAKREQVMTVFKCLLNIKPIAEVTR